MIGASIVVNGWTIYGHPLFLDQLEKLAVQVERAKARNPESYRQIRAAKLLAAIHKLVFEVIPSDPTREEYRQGKTLGAEHTHWFRAKFFQQYPLFFRYHESKPHKVLVFAWVNDEETKRAYGSRTDAYAVFRSMLEHGNPPDDWDALMKVVTKDGTRKRLVRVGKSPQ